MMLARMLRRAEGGGVKVLAYAVDWEVSRCCLKTWFKQEMQNLLLGF